MSGTAAMNDEYKLLLNSSSIGAPMFRLYNLYMSRIKVNTETKITFRYFGLNAIT